MRRISIVLNSIAFKELVLPLLQKHIPEDAYVYETQQYTEDTQYIVVQDVFTDVVLDIIYHAAVPGIRQRVNIRRVP